MGRAGPVPVVLDASALIALERGSRRMSALCREAILGRAALIIPAGVLAQVWRGGPRQAVLAALVKERCVEVVALDTELAIAAGRLCGLRRTSDPIDASVVLIARQRLAVVVSDDVDDLARLDPDLQVERV